MHFDKKVLFFFDCTLRTNVSVYMIIQEDALFIKVNFVLPKYQMVTEVDLFMWPNISVSS